uniref:Uncharacterized protein n=1 Tax=Anguilla anguilla TaxID=7936 RepID=A0A0E9W302_ANGAN
MSRIHTYAPSAFGRKHIGYFGTAAAGFMPGDHHC